MSAATDNLELIADPVLAKKLGRSLRTLARWDDDHSLGFPKPIVINKRKHRRVAEIEAWLSRRALASLGNEESATKSGARS
jgi:predicted DNA-binding transcriptional regulator AlpA